MTETKLYEDRYQQTTLWESIRKMKLLYKFHPYANYFPLMDGQDLKELIKDIKKNGLLETITLFENKILDGRNRYIACIKANVEPKFKQYDKELDPLDFIISENLYRRHLNSFQKGEIGLQLLKKEEKDAEERQIKTQLNGRTEDNKPKFKSSVKSSGLLTEKGQARDKIAKKLKISNKTLDKVKKIKEVAKKDPQIKKQVKNLRKGKTTISRVYSQIKKKEKPKIIPKLPEEEYNVIYADPPWQYQFSETPTRIIEKEYPTMKLEDICNLKIPSGKDSILFLWVTSPKLEEGLKVLNLWGFIYKTSMVWIKDKIGMGYYARSRHEFLLIGTKGNIGVPEPSNRPDSVIESPRTEHSKKPEYVYDLIEQMYPNHKYLELFARNERKNWKSWGNEIED